MNAFLHSRFSRSGLRGYLLAEARSVAPSEGLAIFGLFCIIMIVAQFAFTDRVVPRDDALRYIDYIVNLNLHGVFGLSGGNLGQIPPTGNANAPVYMFLVAGLSYFDDGLKSSLICLIQKPLPANGCALHFTSVLIMQSILSAVTIMLVYLIALRVLAKRFCAFLAALLVAFTGVPAEYAAVILTENVIMPAFLAMVLALIYYLEKPTLVRALFIGLALGLLTLTRPSYLYLLYGFVFFFVATMPWMGLQHNAVRLLSILVGFGVVATPWALRNYIEIGSFELTSGGYAEFILAQRVNYNEMSWAEWAVAFVYWFPDVGDSIAALVFPKYLSEHLGWGAGSYYGGSSDFYRQAVTAAGGPEHVLSYLLKNYVLGHPVKHSMVTIALAWRGIFIAKYWSVIGLACGAGFLFHTVRNRDWTFAAMLSPMVFMVAFHAAVSVSIGRYNLFLMAPYAIGMAWYFNHLATLHIPGWHSAVAHNAE
jgi:4-amino-4-deoxy-L-arabinose transferase-like glycosyltransferase